MLLLIFCFLFFSTALCETYTFATGPELGASRVTGFIGTSALEVTGSTTGSGITEFTGSEVTAVRPLAWPSEHSTAELPSSLQGGAGRAAIGSGDAPNLLQMQAPQLRGMNELAIGDQKSQHPILVCFKWNSSATLYHFCSTVYSAALELLGLVMVVS